METKETIPQPNRMTPVVPVRQTSYAPAAGDVLQLKSNMIPQLVAVDFVDIVNNKIRVLDLTSHDRFDLVLSDFMARLTPEEAVVLLNLHQLVASAPPPNPKRLNALRFEPDLAARFASFVV